MPFHELLLTLLEQFCPHCSNQLLDLTLKFNFLEYPFLITLFEIGVSFYFLSQSLVFPLFYLLQFVNYLPNHLLF